MLGPGEAVSGIEAILCGWVHGYALQHIARVKCVMGQYVPKCRSLSHFELEIRDGVFRHLR